MIAEGACNAGLVLYLRVFAGEVRTTISAI